MWWVHRASGPATALRTEEEQVNGSKDCSNKGSSFHSGGSLCFQEVSDTEEDNDGTGCGVVCPGWRRGEQAGVKLGGGVQCWC